MPPGETPAPAAPASGAAARAERVNTKAAGIVGLAVGSVFGLQAKSKNDDALQPANCPTSKLCNPSGLQLTDDAKSAATVSTVAFAAGGAALVGGVVLWLTAPKASTTVGVDHLVPVVGSSFSGVAMDGRF